VIDSDRQNKGRFLLTGSSSPQIIKGIIESLAGRIATVELSPFKVGEYHATPPSNLYKIITQTPLDIKNLNTLQPIVSLEKSMSCWYLGGFPEPLIGQQLNGYHKQWMENYISNYFNRDIITLFPRLNIHKFRRFLTLLAQYSGHQLNMSNMARSLEVSVSSIKDYLDIIHQTFIWRNLDSFDKNSLKKVQKAKKGFFRDQGLLHYYLKINSLDDLLLHPVAEFSFESFVIEEIIRGLQSTMATQLEFNYYRTIDKSEIDLIIQGDFGTIPIEIKLNSSIKKIALRSLSNFLNDLNLPLGIVINRSKKIEQLTDKIFQIPVNYL